MQEAEITSMAEVWADPAAMTDSDIEAELSEVALKLAEVRASGSRIGELEARRWRLRAEQTFRQRSKR
jgi:hypothetical protein